MRRLVMARERRALAPVHYALYSCDVTYTEPSLPDRFSRLRAALAKQYRLDRALGRGGMATVYLAHDLKHDRPVARSLLHPEIAAVRGPERFHCGVRSSARLPH